MVEKAEPRLAAEQSGEDIVLTYAGIAAARLSLYPVDIETVFSAEPFMKVLYLVSALSLFTQLSSSTG